jgi:CHASE3 domain sensor protein
VQEGALRRLAGLLERLRPATADPELSAVLDEIELRAAVELAKVARRPG